MQGLIFLFILHCINQVLILMTLFCLVMAVVGNWMRYLAPKHFATKAKLIIQ